DDNPQVRKRVAVALGRLGSKARSAIPALEKALRDSDKGVRDAVAAALDNIDPTGKLPEEKKPDNRKPDVPAPQIERREMGKLEPGTPAMPSALLSRPQDKEQWSWVASGSAVFTGDRLVSLPGYRSEVKLDNGVRLTLWGNVFDQLTLPLLESAVVLR